MAAPTLNLATSGGVATTEDLEAQVNAGLAQLFNTKAPLASPAFTGTPTAPTASPGSSTNRIATTEFVQAAIAALVDAAPGTLDTLNELAAALGDDPNFATTITGLINGALLELRNGRVWAANVRVIRGTSAWAVTPPPATDAIMVVSNAGLQTLRAIAAPASPNADIDFQDLSGDWWQLELDTADIDDAITALNVGSLWGTNVRAEPGQPWNVSPRAVSFNTLVNDGKGMFQLLARYVNPPAILGARDVQADDGTIWVIRFDAQDLASNLTEVTSERDASDTQTSFFLTEEADRALTYGLKTRPAVAPLPTFLLPQAVSFSHDLSSAQVSISPSDKPSLPPVYTQNVGRDEFVHPTIVHLPRRLRGFQYWMCILPFPFGTVTLENPSIMASNDLQTWVQFDDLGDHMATPNDTVEPSHLSDADFTYDPIRGELVLTWRRIYTTTDLDADGHSEVIEGISTVDGAQWSPIKKIIGANAPGNAGTVKSSMVSQALIFHPATGKWHMYTGAEFDVELRTKSDIWDEDEPWSAPVNVGPDLWHLEVWAIGRDLYMWGPRFRFQPYGFEVWKSTDESWTSFTRVNTDLVDVSAVVAAQGGTGGQLYKAAIVPMLRKDGTLDLEGLFTIRGPAGEWNTYRGSVSLPGTVARQHYPKGLRVGSRQQIEGYTLLTDRNGNVLLRQRVDGLDFQPSDTLKGRMGQAASFAPAGALYTRLEGSIFAYGMLTAQGQIDEYLFLENKHLLRGGASKGLPAFKMQAITTNGQSLSISFPFDDPASAVDITGDDGWELDGLKRADAAHIYIEARGALSKLYDTGVTIETIRPLALPAPSPTSTAPMVAALNDQRRALGAPRASVLTTSHGYAGVSWYQMDDDPATTGAGGAETDIWDNIVYWYQQAKQVVARLGGTLECPAHVLVHGTSAKTEASPTYYDFLVDYAADFRAMLAAEGIPGAAKMFLTQSASDIDTTNGLLEPWDSKLDQLRFCMEGRGVLAAPLYAYQITDVNVHPSGETTMLFAQVIARAMAEEEAGRRWSSLGPVWHEVDGASVTIWLHTRPDEILQAHDPARYGGEGISFYGFEAEGATVTGVEIGQDRVRVDCDGPPTAIRYAMQQQDASALTSNNYTAQRGLLRTSYAWQAKWTDDTLYRWVPSFKIAL